MTNRQEVAEKLRRIEEDIDHETAFMEIDTIIGTKDNHSLFFFSDRLADLIDPTCKPYITCESLTESLTKYTSECSNCGAIFGGFPTIKQAETTHPVYCPNCGSRVVQE